MKATLFLVTLIVFLAPIISFAQEQGDKEGEVDPKFAAYDKEAADKIREANA